MNKSIPLKPFLLSFLVCVTLLTGCQLPDSGASTPVPLADDTPVVEPVGPLPAALVEAIPMPGSTLGVNRSVTFYFNQPMDQSSVEAALHISPTTTGSFVWEDPSTVTFTPDSGWMLDSELVITIADTAQSADGQALQQEVSLVYQTADYLDLVQQLPAKDTFEVDPTGAVVASFNYPVVPLGADAESLPPAFSLTPAADGFGEWINTSTYIFYPQPGLVGGRSYSVNLDPELTSLEGAPLKEEISWVFSTAQPQLVSFSPGPNERQVRLDQAVQLAFNQPMNTASLENGFRVSAQDGSRVPGEIEWNDAQTVMTFTPDELYSRGQRYDVSIPPGAVSAGGTALSANIGTFSFFAASELFVVSTTPVSGGLKDFYQSVVIYFNAPLSAADLAGWASVEPAVDLNLSVSEKTLYIQGYFEAEQEYTLTVTTAAEDIWGGSLDQAFTLTFRGAPLDTAFNISTYTGSGVMFVSPEDPGMTAQVVNVDRVGVEVGQVSLDEFFYLHSGAGYEVLQSYRPVQVRSSSQTLDIQPNRNQQVGIALNSGQALTPGVYWALLTPNPSPGFSQPQPFFGVVSHVQMVFKISVGDALVWALDTRSNTPVADAPVVLYAASGEILGSGVTDSEGVFYTEIARQENLYTNAYAVLYQQGDELFSLATSSWDWGISPWNVGFRGDYQPDATDYYIYTDRPIYRPGQMVQYRVIARSAFNGRYDLPAADSVVLSVRDYNGAELAGYTLPLSEYGTGAGVYFLSEGAQPGYYELRVGDVGNYSYLTFQVAEYRKPAVDLQVSFEQDEVLAGAPVDAEVLAEYFFDAPVSGVTAGWDLYVDDSYFSLPGYRVGPLPDWAYNPYMPVSGGGLGMWTRGGVGTTDEDGSFAISLETEEAERTQVYTLEITVTDESGMPVSNRVSTTVHPDPIYIGLKSDSWVGRVDTEMGFDIFVVDWARNPAGVHGVEVDFGRVRWERSGPGPFGFYSYEKVVEVLSEGAIETSNDGKARLAFTPDAPGVYQLEARSGRAVTQMLVWVGGPGQASWPTADENQLDLVPDGESYAVGDTASVFIPNPFPEEAQALVTIERGVVMRHETLTISGAGTTITVPLDEDSVPNVYLAVSLVGETAEGVLDYYYGLTNLDVEPEEQILNVQVVGEPERAVPGEVVTFTIRVTDADGRPVQGEFSLSVVDEAVLALADPYEKDIASFFYDRQRLGVRTGSSLLAASEYFVPDAGGLGGGGGDAVSPRIRDEFKDTAYWNASIITGADGTARVEVVLPDNLTTWRVLVRGVTLDTRVGEALSEVVVTKPLLIRPVLPRFAVAGDHLRISAVVHNNTGSAIQASMAFQISGVTLDDPNSALQQFEVGADGRTTVEWWGTVESVDHIEAIFSVEGGGYADITTPENGAIPVLRFLAPQTFSTAGVLAEGGERLEVISLPASFDPASGGLTLEMTSSLAALTLEGLEAIEEAYPSESVEYTISRLLPNLEMLRALRDFGLDAPELEDQLGGEIGDIVSELQGAQNYDGGWGWNNFTGSSQSNAFVSAYALLGLTRAEEMGYRVNEYTLDRAAQYLIQYLVETEVEDDELWKYDRFAFIHFVLVEADSPVIDLLMTLLDESGSLSPWAQALLVTAVEQVDPGNQQAASVFSNLQASAVRSASGAHWENPGRGWQNMASDTFTNAVMIYALARQDPASPLLTDAVRYLMAYRDAEGGWSSSFTTAWALLSLTEVMRGTGELGGEFAFAAALNNRPFATGQAGGAQQFVPVVAEVGLESLLADSPNALTLSREPGSGRLYYRASLQAAQPVEEVGALDRGLTVTRVYYPGGQPCPEGGCTPVTSAQVGDLITVRVTLTLPNSMHYLQVEDFIPAGTEVLDPSLQTSQLGGEYEYYDAPLYDPRDPYAAGWGWWYFGDPAVYDEHVSWNAEFLTAGTYQLAYTLVVLQPGEFQVIPAQAYQVYFPEVQGTSAGAVFVVGE